MSFKLNADSSLEIKPSTTSSQNDFDFFVGKWEIKNRKLKTRLNNSDEWLEFTATQEVKKTLLGLCNTDLFIATVNGEPFEGMTIRLFNPKTKLWSIYWADSNAGVFEPPVVGSFENGIGEFYTKDIFKERPVLVKFNWDATNPLTPVWSQAFSADEGNTWEWNWYMYFEKMQNS